MYTELPPPPSIGGVFIWRSTPWEIQEKNSLVSEIIDKKAWHMDDLSKLFHDHTHFCLTTAN